MEGLDPDERIVGRFVIREGEPTIILSKRQANILELLRTSTGELRTLFAHRADSMIWHDMTTLKSEWKEGEVVPDWALTSALQVFSHKELFIPDTGKSGEYSSGKLHVIAWNACVDLLKDGNSDQLESELNRWKSQLERTRFAWKKLVGRGRLLFSLGLDGLPPNSRKEVELQTDDIGGARDQLLTAVWILESRVRAAENVLLQNTTTNNVGKISLAEEGSKRFLTSVNQQHAIRVLELFESNPQTKHSIRTYEELKTKLELESKSRSDSSEATIKGAKRWIEGLHGKPPEDVLEFLRLLEKSREETLPPESQG